MNNSLICWVFDVDGVLTDPQAKKITQKGLIEEIAKKIDNGDIVTFNTGRSLSWTEERVLSPLAKSVKNKSKLEDLFISAEKGGTWAYFKDGKMVRKIDKQTDLPISLRQEIRELIASEFSDSMFYEESKAIMISPEMIDGYNIAEYNKKQLVLVERIKQILDKPKYKKLNLRIDPTIIAVDIQKAHIGKHFGARRIANWLKEKGFNPSRIIMLGDSQSDTEMAEELQDEYPVDFVFVGDLARLNTEKLRKKPIFTNNHHEAGTLEFLTSFRK